MKILVPAIAASLALVACNPGEPGSANGSTDANAAAMPDDANMMDTNAAMMNDTGAAAPMTAQQFANTAAASDAYEIASSRLATDKAESAEVKTFATTMVRDHGKSTADLKAAAGSLTPDPAMNAEQKANVAELQGLNGAAFDAAYSRQQLAAHQKTLAALQGYAASGDNAGLKTFASNTAPVVQGHLTMLQGMQ